MANDRIPATLQRHVADRLQIPEYRVAKVRATPQFEDASRASLFLGMSDGGANRRPSSQQPGTIQRTICDDLRA